MSVKITGLKELQQALKKKEKEIQSKAKKPLENHLMLEQKRRKAL